MTASTTPAAEQRPTSLLADHPIAVIGGGYMGGGIAQTLASRGLTVRLSDASADHAAAAVDRLVSQARGYVTEGLWPTDAADRVARNLSAATTLEAACDGAGYVTEAVPEEVELKREVLTRIGYAVAPTAIVGSNTSAIGLAALADALPQSLLAVHWFNPAPFVPLVEVAGEDEEAVGHVHDLLTDIGKHPVRVPDVPGFLANRLQFALYREAALIVQEGLADPDQVDEIVSNSFGCRLPFFGPLAVGDMAGLDVYDNTFATLAQTYGPRFSAPAILSDRRARGDLGLKTGRGITSLANDSRATVEQRRDRSFAALATLRCTLDPGPDHDRGRDAPRP